MAIPLPSISIGFSGVSIGLPPLPAIVFQDFNPIDLVFGDVLSLLPGTSSDQWGLFLDGEPVVVADNVVGFEFKQDYRIASYPVEEGSFESYNKVQTPFGVRLRFSSGGSAADRQALIESVDNIIGSLDQFDGVTPEKVYENLNPVHQDLHRTARNGVGLLVIDVFCEQVRVTATPQFASSQTSTSTAATGSTATSSSSNFASVQSANQRVAGGFASINQPQSPSAAPQVSSGTVQAVTPTPDQSASFTDARGTGFDF